MNYQPAVPRPPIIKGGERTLAEYFEQTKGEKQRSLRRLGHYQPLPPKPIKPR